jgi:gamma-glutamyl hercynylcysteine S-oxide synthase
MQTTIAPSAALDRGALRSRFDRVRARSRVLFDLITEEAYYSRPIALRNPIVFYEGHLSAFAVNTLLKKALDEPPIDPALEMLFARGIDPENEVPAASLRAQWPSRDRVLAYVSQADDRLREAIAGADLDRPGHPLLDRAEALHAIIEHEEMHQETLQYIWHRLPFEQKHRPPDAAPVTGDAVPGMSWQPVPAGRATLGADRGAIVFGWDNEMPRLVVEVPAFEIAQHDVTNAEFLAFVEEGGYTREDLWTPEAWSWRMREQIAKPLFWERVDERWYWRGMFELVPLPLAWPVYVSHAEASAFARWRGCRLPTEPEFHRAAYGDPAGGERDQPWGGTAADSSCGNFGAVHWDPVPVGSYPSGTSAFGVHDLVGNGWEWTASTFGPFPGFTPMASYPEYSADFFDGAHFVMKGASPATPAAQVRRSFRNWFRPYYPYVYATFRCARG